MHAEDDRQPLLRLRRKLLDLIGLDGAEHVVQADEVDAVHRLRRETRVHRIPLPQDRPAAGLERLLPRVLLVRQVGVELVVADRAEHRLAVVPLHEIEVRLALEVDEVARVDDVVDVLLRPVERVAKRLLLAPAERARALRRDGNLVDAFALVRAGEVRVGDVQHGERLLQPDLDMLVRERQTLVGPARRKHRRHVRLRLLRQRRNRHQSAQAADKRSSVHFLILKKARAREPAPSDSVTSDD